MNVLSPLDQAVLVPVFRNKSIEKQYKNGLLSRVEAEVFDCISPCYQRRRYTWRDFLVEIVTLCRSILFHHP